MVIEVRILITDIDNCVDEDALPSTMYLYQPSLVQLPTQANLLIEWNMGLVTS